MCKPVDPSPRSLPKERGNFQNLPVTQIFILYLNSCHRRGGFSALGEGENKNLSRRKAPKSQPPTAGPPHHGPLPQGRVRIIKMNP